MFIPQMHRCYYRQVDGIVILRNLEGDDPFRVSLAPADFDEFCDRNPHVEVIPDPEAGQEMNRDG
jgi:hypothetical protein